MSSADKISIDMVLVSVSQQYEGTINHRLSIVIVDGKQGQMDLLTTN
jgi:hypothetical protein